MEQSNSFPPPLFDIRELAEGVYAALPGKNSPLFSNAGIIDLGERTLVFDTFNTLQGGTALLEAALALTGRTPALVIISHCHGDHWMGNQAFGTAPILCTTTARREMEEEALPTPAEIEEQIHNMEERLKTESDPRWRSSLESSLARLRYNLQSTAFTRLILPGYTFEGEIVFHGSKRRAVLSSRGHSHSPGDAVLCLPQDAVAFIGDLGFFQQQPYMGACVPQAWHEQMLWLGTSSCTVFVPGHGPLGGKEDLLQLDRYMEWLVDRVCRARAEGLAMEEVIAGGLPAPFDAWLMGGMGRFENNVRSLMNLPTPF